MHDRGQTSPGLKPKPVLVLGTDDIASAVGHALASDGVPVLLVRDPEMPVLRRQASFDDALELGAVRLGGMTALCRGRAVRRSVGAMLAVTDLAPEKLMDPALIEGVIDARMRRGQRRPACAGISASPSASGRASPPVRLSISRWRQRRKPPAGSSAAARRGRCPAESSLLAGDEGQCVVRAPRSGLWWTFRDIGETLEAGAVVGLCAGGRCRPRSPAVCAAWCGVARLCAPACGLLEVDPRPEDERCRGISPLAARIAAATVSAVRELWQPPRRGAAARGAQMAHVIFWGKPGCAGNAKQMALLRASGHRLEVRDLSAEPWTAHRLRPFFGDTPVRVWFNTSAPKVKRGELRPETLTEADAMALLLAEPLLIRRPLLQCGETTIAGFDTGPDCRLDWPGQRPTIGRRGMPSPRYASMPTTIKSETGAYQ